MNYVERLTEKPACSTCELMHERKGEVPNCADCMPEVMPENMDVLRVFLTVKDQHIMGAGGPIALNLEPVFRLMDLLSIKDQERCLGLVKKMYDLMAQKIRDLNP